MIKVDNTTDDMGSSFTDSLVTYKNPLRQTPTHTMGMTSSSVMTWDVPVPDVHGPVGGERDLAKDFSDKMKRDMEIAMEGLEKDVIPPEPVKDPFTVDDVEDLLKEYL